MLLEYKCSQLASERCDVLNHIRLGRRSMAGTSLV